MGGGVREEVEWAGKGFRGYVGELKMEVGDEGRIGEGGGVREDG